MNKSDKFIYISIIACIVACIGEFVSIFILGAYYPGYSQMKDTMSSLGASLSPVSAEISLWWTIMGILFIFFAFGFRKAFSDKGQYSKIATYLIICYGLGEGIGSGIFKADHINNDLTFSAIIHNIVGGLGVTASLILPLIMLKVIPKHESQVFHKTSKIIFIIGIVTIVLFMFRYLNNQNNIISIYKGLWQRLFMLNFYTYLTIIAIFMIKKRNNLFD